MKSLRSFASLAILLLATFFGVLFAGLAFAPAPAAVASAPDITPGVSAGVITIMLLGVTLTSQEILGDVMAAFAKWFPALNRMGTDFRPSALKLNQTYTAHIPTLPVAAAYDATTGYANGAQTGRSLLVDVDILVDQHKHVPLQFKHLDAIKDQKNRYEECIGNTGYVLAKTVIDDALAKCDSRRFTQETTFATADCDFEMLNDVTEKMNSKGALPTGRVLLVNSAVASTLAADARISSRDYSGQQPGGDGYRVFRNVGGFAEIIEYPDLPSNNGSTFNITGVASTDVITTDAAHGLAVGDIVTIPTVTGGSGITASATTRYRVASVPSTTTLTLTVVSTGSALNFTTDISGGTLKKTENLVAFGFDQRAMALLAGVPEDFAQSGLAAGLGIQQIMAMQSMVDPLTGLAMAGVSWQAVGTGDLFYSPTLVWGWALGRQSAANAAGSKCDYGGIRVISA